MAADGDNGTVEALGRAQQLHHHFLTSIETLGEAWNDYQAISSHERHDDSGSTLDRRRYHLLAHAPQPDAQIFVLACGRQHFPADVRHDLRTRERRQTQLVLDERLD